MLSLDVLLPLVIGLLVLQLSPGPDMLLVLDRSMTHGAKFAFATIAGIVLIAGAIQIVMLVSGLDVLVRGQPSIVPVLRIAGAIYLCYLGVRMMTTSLRVPEPARARSAGIGAAVREGALSSLTNPKTFLFLFVVLPQFVDPLVEPVWLQMLVLGSLHKLAGLVTLSAVALAADRIGCWMKRWPRLLPIQRNLCGVLMVGIGATLATHIPYPS